MLYGDIDLNSYKGLSEKEANALLSSEGYNELPSVKRVSFYSNILEIVREPMFVLLVACGVVYLFLGDTREALMLIGFVFVIVGITLYQEGKTERALDALRDLSSPRAHVVREGIQRRIPGREVVQGDILLLSEGDRIPADSVLLSCLNFSVDESLLTGESVPVSKMNCDGSALMGKPGGNNTPFVYSGTMVVQGRGVALVKTTGVQTEIGRIGKSLLTIGQERSRLQEETGRLVRTVAVMGLLLCALVAVIYGLTRNDWLQGSLAGITLAMAMLPEEFPVVLTIFLALGAWRLSRKRVLTRKIPVIETLGAATVLCVDKTGTLTENRMSAEWLYAGGEMYAVDRKERKGLPEKFHEIVEFSILASHKDPFDPMEKAIRDLGDHYLLDTEHVHEDWTLVHEYPLSQEIMAISHVWKSPGGGEYVIAAKGAPEAIVDLCHCEDRQKEEIYSVVRRMSEKGLRVLGIARASFRVASLPGQQHDFRFELLGLIGLADPVRKHVEESIRECHEAGIRVVMITGDYKGTATSIARAIGLQSHDECISGDELDRMSDDDLRSRIKDAHVFARVVPEQKLRIVEALKAVGETVAMTGDGVNDAPALKSAHIGIAMGSRGTDVAREAADIVLLDDDFSSIVSAVRMGRRIFDNMRKAISYIFAVHIPIAGISLVPVLMKWPLILLPVHIVFLELIIDPACTIVFEAESDEGDIMRRNPRRKDSSLFGKKTVVQSLMQGLGVLLILTGIFAVSLYRGGDVNDSRALTFTTLVLANLALIMANRSWSLPLFKTFRVPNRALWIITTSAIAFLSLVLFVPVLRELFHFSVLHTVDLLICIAAGVLSVIWFEYLKVLTKWRCYLPVR